MPAPKRPLWSQMEGNTAGRCDDAKCSRSRHKFSRWCFRHGLNYDRHGHPDVVVAISRQTWSPFVCTAHTFLTQQIRGGHRGVEDAIRWLHSEMVGSGAVRRRSGSRGERGYQAGLDRCRTHGVESLDLLARVVAAELADDRGDAARPIFLSDNHQRHSFARLFLHAAPHGQAQFYRRRREPAVATSIQRISESVSTRVFTYRRVHGALGLLGSYAAKEITRRAARTTSLPPTQHVPVTGSAVPFNAT